MMIGDRPGEWQPLNPPRSMLGMIAVPAVVFLTLWVSIFVLPMFVGRVPLAGAQAVIAGGHPPSPAPAWSAAAVALTCWWWTSAACCTIIVTVVARLRGDWVPSPFHGPIASIGCGWIALASAVPAFTAYIADTVVTRAGAIPARDTVILCAIGMGVALMILGGVQLLERSRSRPSSSQA
jgi:hypothetical protein